MTTLTITLPNVLAGFLVAAIAIQVCISLVEIYYRIKTWRTKP